MNEQYILRNYSLLDLINKQIDEFTELGKRNIVLLQNAATYTASELHTSLAFSNSIPIVLSHTVCFLFLITKKCQETLNIN